MAESTSPILLAGGSRDPHLIHLHGYLLERGIDSLFLAVGQGKNPSFTWDLGSNRLFVDEKELTPRAVFLRHDVFSEEQSFRLAVFERSYAWYVAVISWLECHPGVQVLNRRSLGRPIWKPAALRLAAQNGLAVPATLITNHLRNAEVFAKGRPAIAKPIDGGDYTKRLEDVVPRTATRNGAAAQPAIVQPELIAPEVRIYGVAGRFIGFKILSKKLDYRADPQVRVERLAEVPPHLSEGLGKLMAALGLDFCAADFKTSPETGELLFLEINDTPMFALFDSVAKGAIADAITDFLLRSPNPR